MASSGTSKGQQEQTTGPTTSLSFVPGLLARSFLGTSLGVSDGGFQIGGQNEARRGLGIGANIDPNTLDPNALVSNLLDLADPNANRAVGFAEGLLGLGQEGALAGVDFLQNDVLSQLKEGIQTGFQPDIEPVREQALRTFFQDIVPGLGQQNVALQEGVGPFSTDLSSGLLDAGADISTNLGALETQLANDAANRRADLLGISNLVAGNLSQIPFLAGSQALDLGEQLILQGTAGGRQAQLLSLLGGQVPPSATGQGVESSGSSSSKNVGVLS